MNTPTIIVREVDASYLRKVRSLWEDLYKGQRTQGLQSHLAPDGFDKWSATLSTMIGRFACLIVAQSESELIGFLAGRLRTPTAPFEPLPVGFISEIYVSPTYRTRGVGRRLLDAATTWFAEQDVIRLELQVLCNNTIAADAYRRWGWRNELIQMTYYIQTDQQANPEERFSTSENSATLQGTERARSREQPRDDRESSNAPT